MALTLGFVYRLVHVTAAIVWFGAGVYYLGIVEPHLRKLSGRPFFEAYGNQVKRHMPFFIVSGLVTIVAGILTADNVFHSFDPGAWSADYGPTGRAIALGMGFGVLAFLMGPLHGVAKARLDRALAGAWDAQSENKARGAVRLDSALSRVAMALLAVAIVFMVGAHTDLLA